MVLNPKLKLSIPSDVGFPHRDDASKSDSSGSLGVELPPPVSEALVKEGLEMLMSEFQVMKMKLRAPPLLLPSTPAFFHGASPMPTHTPPPLSFSSCPPLSPYPTLTVPLSAGFIHSSHSPHPGFLDMISPLQQMPPPQTTMIPRKSRQIFFGQNFDGRCLQYCWSLWLVNVKHLVQGACTVEVG